MAPNAGVPFESFTAAVYGAAEGSLAQPEASRLAAARFDTGFYSKAYLQCIGRGLSHEQCIRSLPDDVRVPAGGPLTSGTGQAGVQAAISSASERSSAAQLETHFDGLARLAGYEDPVIKSSYQKVSEFSSKAGWKMLGFPALFFAIKFV
mmetsp:Transcript_2994/g.8647  ORF Transcript_2994/g.8647 Transcript_2994/m.8647 type:complete len:150 (-) Transcript_2994:2-451(-)